MRYPLATDLKSRTGAPDRDARQTNAYIEVKGNQSVVRKRPSAQGGVSVGTGTAQGGIGLNIGGTDYIYTVNGDTVALDTLATAGTTWDSGTSYLIGDHVSYGFVDYWALTDNSNSNPSSNPSDWSSVYVPAVPVTTYATWNPADTHADLTLSNGNLSISDLDDSGVNSRATIGKSTGKWYWEVTIHAYSGTVAVGNTSVGLDSSIGSNSNGWAYNDLFGVSGIRHNSITTQPWGNPFSVGDVISVLLNMDDGELTLWQNGIDLGLAFNNLTGTLYPMFGTVNGGAAVICTANFGASAFAYSVPSGYNSGLYTL